MFKVFESLNVFFLVRIFLHSEWIQENTDQKKLLIWTLYAVIAIHQIPQKVNIIKWKNSCRRLVWKPPLPRASRTNHIIKHVNICGPTVNICGPTVNICEPTVLEIHTSCCRLDFKSWEKFHKKFWKFFINFTLY